MSIPIAILVLLSFMLNASQCQGHSNELPSVLHQSESPLDESSAKFLKAEIENGLIFTPTLCKYLGFFCEPGLKLELEGNAKHTTLKDRSVTIPLPHEGWEALAWSENDMQLKKNTLMDRSVTIPLPHEGWRTSPLNKKDVQLKKDTLMDRSLTIPLPHEGWETSRWNKKDVQLKKNTLMDRSVTIPLPHEGWEASDAQKRRLLESSLWKNDEQLENNLSEGAELRLPKGEIPEGMAFRLSSLKPGSKVKLSSLIDAVPSKFLHPVLRETLPLKAEHIPQFLSTLALPEDTEIAYLSKLTAQACNSESREPHLKETACALSTEELLQAVHKILHEEMSGCRRSSCQLKWIAQELPHEKLETVKVVYTKVLSDTAAVCHTMPFPYTVYGCHKITGTKVLEVKLLGHEPIAVPVICHMDTSSFRTDHPAFRLLNMKPGDGEICHWVYQRTIIWYV